MSANSTTVNGHGGAPLDRQDSYLQREQSRGALGNRPAEGEASAPVEPPNYQYSFWDPRIAHIRRAYLKIMLPAIMLISIMMWITVPAFWGSLGEQTQHIANLNGWFINRDPQGVLGQSLQKAFELNSIGQGPAGKMHITWIVMSPDDFPTDQDVADGVVEEKVWTAVVVEAGATQNAITARSIGNSSYNPQSAVTFYYNQGRNEIAAGSYINPLTSALLTQSLAQISAQFTAQWIGNSSGNTTALTLAATQAPQTISGAFAFKAVNLRPFTKPVSTAVLLVGQIYLTIFAFVITMAHDAARGVIQPFLNFRSYVLMRLAFPLLAYIPLSLNYSLIQLPFKLTFGEKYGSGAKGWWTFFIFVYLGMAAQGLATEAMITLLTPKFIANFLLVLIIYNVSVGSVPIVLQPGFYRYGYGFPVYNLSQAVRTIIFNTKSHLGRNAGVLIGWILLSCCTITIFTFLIRKRDIRRDDQPGDQTPTINAGDSRNTEKEKVEA